jgi:hypothetical protein
MECLEEASSALSLSGFIEVDRTEVNVKVTMSVSTRQDTSAILP